MRNILIIDDVKEQAEGLAKALSKVMPDISFDYEFSQEGIIDAVENRFFSVAIVDIRMDPYEFNGIDIINKIFEINPFAKILIVSAFKDEYILKLKDLLLSGKILDIQDKKSLEKWIPELKEVISNYFTQLENNPSEINNALMQFYSEVKNEKDSFKKGSKFENFISLIFQSIGFNEVLKRVKDKSLNEVDLIIRNDIEDNFLSKFGKYILVECKNKPKSKVNKNDFIVFSSKLKNTNGLAELGIIATTGLITRNTYLEALRESSEIRKVLFLSNPEIIKLIRATDKLNAFKNLIDLQVKDN